MTEEKRISYSVVNQQRQPVEVHLLDRVLVLGPNQELPVAPQEVKSPHLEELRKSRLISIRETEDIPAPQPETGDTSTSSDSATATRRKAAKRDADGL